MFRGRYLRDIVTEYSLATDRLLEKAAKLQSVLRANMELIIQVNNYYFHQDRLIKGYRNYHCLTDWSWSFEITIFSQLQVIPDNISGIGKQIYTYTCRWKTLRQILNYMQMQLNARTSVISHIMLSGVQVCLRTIIKKHNQLSVSLHGIGLIFHKK